MGNGGNTGLFLFLWVFQPSLHPHRSLIPQIETSNQERPEVSTILLPCRDESRGLAPGPIALLLFVNVFMGCQAHLYHQHHELLKVNSTILIDVQLFEPSVCILFL